MYVITNNKGDIISIESISEDGSLGPLEEEYINAMSKERVQNLLAREYEWKEGNKDINESGQIKKMHLL